MLWLTLKVALGDSLGLSLAAWCRLWYEHPTHFILIAGLNHAHIKCFSTFYCSWQSYECDLSLILILIWYALAHSHSVALVFDVWGPSPSSYSYHIITGVWYTLYVVSGHMVVAKHSSTFHLVYITYHSTKSTYQTTTTTMSWLRRGITVSVEWTALLYYIYKKCLKTFYCDGQS